MSTAWRIPIMVAIGLVLSLFLSSLGMPTWLYLTLFIMSAVVIAIVAIYIEEILRRRKEKYNAKNR